MYRRFGIWVLALAVLALLLALLWSAGRNTVGGDHAKSSPAPVELSGPARDADVVDAAEQRVDRPDRCIVEIGEVGGGDKVDASVRNDDGSKVTLVLTVESRDGRCINAASSGREDELPALHLGDVLRICVRASRDGYMTLWNHRVDDDGLAETKRLYPRDDQAVPVIAGVSVCPGSTDAHCCFMVRGGGDLDAVIAHWTENEASALPDGVFPDVFRRGRNSSRSDAIGGTLATLRYRVLQ